MLPLRLERLTKVYAARRGAVLAVDDISLSIEAGELFFLLGPSGCGKTTLLRMLAGFVEPTSGRIFFGDHDVTDLPAERRDAAMVFQNYALWPHMTVSGNVGFGLEVRGMGRSQREQTVAEMLRTVRIAEKAAAKPMELSGGQQQRVALARALAVRPQCLLLDEPLSNLDAALRAAMRWEIRRIVKSRGATAVYVTHDQAEAMAIADRIALLKDGRIVQIGSGQELYDRPGNRFVATFLGEANIVPGKVAGREGDLLAMDTPLGRLLGRSSADLPTGREAWCCIRPEGVRLARPADQARCTSLTGRLLEWTHLGDSGRFRLQGPGGVELAGAVMPARAPAVTDQTVEFHLAAGDIVVLPE